MPPIYEHATIDIPGIIQRPENYWKVIEKDFESKRNNESKMQHVVYIQDKQINGYVSYRPAPHSISVHELIGIDLNSVVALWRFCLDMDLRLQAQIYRRPLDDILPFLLIDSGKLSRTIKEGLWLRLVNVREALAVRKYAIENKNIIRNTLILDSPYFR